ncbi:MAG: hypothetical protein ACXVC1_05105 [Tumebacillaceae bacterium]
MALSDIPPVKPPKNAVYFAGIFLATFVFWFTRPKASDEAAVESEGNIGNTTRQTGDR